MNERFDIFPFKNEYISKIQLLIGMGVDEVSRAEHDIIPNDGQLITSFASTT